MISDKLLIPLLIIVLTFFSCNSRSGSSLKDDYRNSDDLSAKLIFEVTGLNSEPVITCGEPVWCKTKLAHWKSKDGLFWVRSATLFESSGDFTGNDSHAALWSPMPAFDEKQNCWILTYVCYRSKPNTPENWYRNYDGRIALARSVVKGKKGIDGPYIETGIIMKPDSAVPKLGLMGVDSFFPFEVDGKWIAFYGSSTEWNGLAFSPALTGSWNRSKVAGVVSRHTENPVVSKLPDGRYIAFFDGFYASVGMVRLKLLK